MDLIQKLQDIDVFKVSEELSGDEYLALQIQREKTKRLDELYDLTSDTKFHEKSKSYKAKVEAFGFKTIYQKEFISDGETETHYVMFHDDYCLLLNWDTYTGTRNSATLYFNLLCSDYSALPNRSNGGWQPYLSSNTFEKVIIPFDRPMWRPSRLWEEHLIDVEEYNTKLQNYSKEHNLVHVFIGFIDAREGIKSYIHTATKKATFIDWKFPHEGLWLLNHGDTKNPSYNSDKLSEQVWRTFPENIQKRLKLI